MPNSSHPTDNIDPRRRDGSDNGDATGHEEEEHEMTQQEQREEIAKRESRAVSYLRILVLGVLVASALAVVVSVYKYMTHEEEEEFEQAVDSAATKVFQAVGRTLDQTLGSTDAFVLQLLQYAKHSSTSTTWPFVTVPGFPQQAGKLLKLSKAFFCSVAVVVTPQQQAEWGSYTVNNTHWIDETIKVQLKNNHLGSSRDENDPFSTRNSSSYTVNPFIFGFSGPMTEPTPYSNNYLPQWQHYPISENFTLLPVNWDNWVVPSAAAALSDSIAHQRIAIAPASNIVPTDADENAVFMVNNIRNWARNYIPPEEDATEPFLSIWLPMYEAATESIQIDLPLDGDPGGRNTAQQQQRQQPVGFFAYWFFWKGLIRGILPNDSGAVIVVVSNPCGPSFTYRLDGPKTTYLGVGDMHDSKYDDLRQTQTLSDVMESTKQSEEGSSYVGIPLSETHCVHTIHVYPSGDMEDEYVTNDPIVFTVAAASIFIFTSLVFILYDCIVARRQRIVMERALASGAIVNSLFPEKVRKQLYEEQKQEKEKERTLKDFLSLGGEDGTNNNFNITASNGPPLAELFDETTIFFADLAGFTAWLANRTPVQVFLLLETLYGAFDRLANKRNVFKISTIGDCYVAATGIPERQKHHALIMCRFASDCMAEMNQITQDLVDSLGEDTMELEMRIGLHSGATTAGVLRGEKIRFELFGDTVNTASRMESNGVKGRIHVSQATADALIASGKEHWLMEREDRVSPKGKGEMVTYFVDVHRNGTDRTGTSGDFDAEAEDISSIFASAFPTSPSHSPGLDLDD